MATASTKITPFQLHSFFFSFLSFPPFLPLSFPSSFPFLSLSSFSASFIFYPQPTFPISGTTHESIWGSTLNYFSALKIKVLFTIPNLPPGRPRKWDLPWESPQSFVHRSPWPTPITNEPGMLILIWIPLIDKSYTQAPASCYMYMKWCRNTQGKPCEMVHLFGGGIRGLFIIFPLCLLWSFSRPLQTLRTICASFKWAWKCQVLQGEISADVEKQIKRKEKEKPFSC